MYDKIGAKIKSLTIVVFCIEAVLTIITAFAMIGSTRGISILIGLIVIVLVWISSWFIYGFGEIIDKLFEIERNTRPSGSNFKNPHYPSETETEKRRLDNLTTEEIKTEAGRLWF